MILAAWSGVGATRMAAVVDFPQTLGAFGAGTGAAMVVAIATGAFDTGGVTVTGAGMGTDDATMDAAVGLDLEESFWGLVGVGDHTVADALSPD